MTSSSSSSSSSSSDIYISNHISDVHEDITQNLQNNSTSREPLNEGMNSNEECQETIKQPPSNSTEEKLITKDKLQELLLKFGISDILEESVEEILLELVDDFLEQIISSACSFAKHRNANTINVNDVQLFLDRFYGLWHPGYSTELHTYNKSLRRTEAHKERLFIKGNAIRRMRIRERETKEPKERDYR